MDELVKWGWAIVLLINLFLGWLLWSMRAAFVPRADFDKLATRVALIEQELRHLPTHKDFAVLRDDVAQLEGKVDAQQQLLAGISASVRRIEDYLLNTKAKA
ncbi:MAG TPA: DUF2730 family protein [Azospirillum sp.]|nr:DUF2730 family protein [Azospirillum sp.]